MIVLVSGSREGFTYKEFIKHFEENLDVNKIEEIVAGGARGIDTFAKLYSKGKELNLLRCLQIGTVLERRLVL